MRSARLIRNRPAIMRGREPETCLNVTYDPADPSNRGALAAAVHAADILPDELVELELLEAADRLQATLLNGGTTVAKVFLLAAIEVLAQRAIRKATGVPWQRTDELL